MTIGKAIKQYRLNQGLTQLELAIKIDKTSRTIMRYENNQTIPSIKVIEQIFNKQITKEIAALLMED